jgi:hypothetical protein
MTLALLLVVVLGVAQSTAASPSASWSCTSDASCQLNGVCISGTCHCDAQWVGSNCSTLNAGASKPAYTGMTSDQTAWGGHPIWDAKSKLWHGYFAEMTEHCTLSAWTTNSIIVHATSSSVDGPFEFKDVVQPAWSHNPLVTQDPITGDILIAHIGCGKIAAGMKPKNCSKQQGDRAEQHDDVGPLPGHGGPCECPNYGAKVPPHVPCQTIQVMRSSTGPDGPWVDETVAWPLLNTSEWPSSLSNPTLLFPTSPGDKVLLGFNGNMAPPLNKVPLQAAIRAAQIHCIEYLDKARLTAVPCVCLCACAHLLLAACSQGGTSHAGLMASRSGSWKGPCVYIQQTLSFSVLFPRVRLSFDWDSASQREVKCLTN